MKPNGTDNWSILSATNMGETITEIMAAKSEDGIGVVAQWQLSKDGWKVKVWHTEMPSEGRTENDDSGCVPDAPPVDKLKGRKLGVMYECEECKNGTTHRELTGKWVDLGGAGDMFRPCDVCEGAGKVFIPENTEVSPREARPN